MTDLAFADLFAGSGAVGLEAASRGAGRVLLVESDARAAGTIRRNAENLTAVATVCNQPVERLIQTTPPDGPFDVVFADPPYRHADAAVDALLAALQDNSWFAARAVVVVERDRRSRSPQWPQGITPVKSRGYGEATLWYGRRS
jgi:16S rRNA (guanine(966)-N(2))-methyltransferase RsmD